MMTALLWAVALGSPNPIIVPGAAPIGPGGVFSTNVDLNGNDLLNPDDILHTASATDDAARNLAVTSQAAMHKINATNNDGGNLCDIPASGNNDLTGVTKAGTAGDTVTFYYQLSDCTASSVTITEGDGTGGTYECDGAADDATCVANLIATVEANATLGPITAAVTRVGETTMWYPEGAGLWLKVVPSDGVNTVVSRGTDGVKIVPDGTAALPGVRLATEATGLYLYGTAALGFATAGTLRGYIDNSTLYSATNITSATTGAYKFGSRSAMTSSADGYARLSNSAQSGAGAWQIYPQTVSCDADCDSPVTLSSNVVVINCTNAGGCALGLAETNWSATAAGTVTLVAGPTQTGVLTLADAANVTELAGGVSWTPTERDTITLAYSPTLYWVEIGRADNTP